MYKEVIIGWFKHFDFLLLDAGLLEVSLIIAYWLRHGFGGVPPLYQNGMLPSYRTMKYKSPIWGYFHVQKE